VDIRLFVVVMAIAIIMDIIGRMARKRAGEQQAPPGEEWDMLNALTEQAEELRRRHREAPGPGEAPPLGEAPPRAEAPVPRQEQRIGGFEVWSELTRPAPPEVVEPEPVVEPAAPEPVFRDRAPRPHVAREPVFRDRAPRAPVAEEPVFRDRTPRPVVVRATRVAADRDHASPRTFPAAAVKPGPAARTARLDDRFGLGTAGGLRNAIVVREVLGPPLALRGEEGRPGAR